MNNTHIVAIKELQTRMGERNNESLEERIKLAMNEVKNEDWLIRTEDDMFKVAVGAILLEATDEERELINQEIKFLKALSAASDGVDVNFGSLFNDIDPSKSIGLLKYWRERDK